MVTGSVASYISTMSQEATMVQLIERESLKLPLINPWSSFMLHIIAPNE